MAFLPANYTVQHAKFLGNGDDEGYPTEDQHAAFVDRPAYGWYPGQGAGLSAASASDPGGDDYARRLTSYKIVQVPDPSLYSYRDKVKLDGLEFFVAGDVMDYTTGPFGFKPGGEIFVQRTTG